MSETIEITKEQAEAYRLGADSAIQSVLKTLNDSLSVSVRAGEVENDYAVDLYNTVASSVSQPRITSFKATYTVTVSVFGSTILEISDVEADDEDEACEKVADNLTVESLDVNFALDSLGFMGYGSANDYDFDFSSIILDNIECEATVN